MVLLVSKESSYLTEVRKSQLHTRDGILELSELLKRRFGENIKTHLCREFVIVKPNIKDILEKRVKRTAQVILPKDIALILAYTGISSDSLVVDAGTGTGYLAIFLANFIPNGRVVTYENDKKFAKTADENIKNSGMKNIKLKQKDITKHIEEKNADLVTLDMQNPHRAVKNAYGALKPGGWLVVYSPIIEEVISVNKEIRKYEFCNIETVENIIRVWQTERTTRPKNIGLMHTGWLTFARKLWD